MRRHADRLSVNGPDVLAHMHHAAAVRSCLHMAAPAFCYFRDVAITIRVAGLPIARIAHCCPEVGLRRD
jgi:hypothetical protein